MVDIWEDNERLASKFVSISKAEAFFTITSLVCLYADEKTLTYTFLFIALSIALIPLVKRSFYERRKKAETKGTGQPNENKA